MAKLNLSMILTIILIISIFFRAGIPPIVMCLEASTFIGSGSCVVLAALYGVLAIGKK